MHSRNIWILLVWALCAVLDRLGFVATDDPQMQVSFVGALIGGIASAASGIFGAAAANRRRRQAERELEKQKKKLTQWRDAEMGTNYLDRADSRAALRRVFEYNKEAQKAANTNAVKSGMTDEAKVAQAAKLNENYADAVSQIAGAGARHKDRVQQQYLDEMRNLDNLKIQNLMDTSGVDNMVQGITGAVAGLGTALAGGTGVSGGGSTKTGVGVSPQVQSMAQNAAGIPAWEGRYKIG